MYLYERVNFFNFNAGEWREQNSQYISSSFNHDSLKTHRKKQQTLRPLVPALQFIAANKQKIKVYQTH